MTWLLFWQSKWWKRFWYFIFMKWKSPGEVILESICERVEQPKSDIDYSVIPVYEDPHRQWDLLYDALYNDGPIINSIGSSRKWCETMEEVLHCPKCWYGDSWAGYWYNNRPDGLIPVTYIHNENPSKMNVWDARWRESIGMVSPEYHDWLWKDHYRKYPAYYKNYDKHFGNKYI